MLLIYREPQFWIVINISELNFSYTVGLYTTNPLFDDLKGLFTIKDLGLTFDDRTFNGRVIDLVGDSSSSFDITAISKIDYK